MATLAGLELEARYSDWNGSPLDSQSPRHVCAYRKPPALGRAAADDAKRGDRVEVAQLLRGEAVAGVIPAGDVEAQREHGDGGGAGVADEEVARAYAVRDDLPDDPADLSLPGGDVGQMLRAERAGLV